MANNVYEILVKNFLRRMLVSLALKYLRDRKVAVSSEALQGEVNTLFERLTLVMIAVIDYAATGNRDNPFHTKEWNDDFQEIIQDANSGTVRAFKDTLSEGVSVEELKDCYKKLFSSKEIIVSEIYEELTSPGMR
jgi:hypothetical protein